MRVRIVNNGSPGYMTQITEAETGKPLDLRIVEVSIHVLDEIPHAFLTCNAPVIDIVADAEIKHVCPCCGKPLDELERDEDSVEQVE